MFGGCSVQLSGCGWIADELDGSRIFREMWKSMSHGLSLTIFGVLVRVSVTCPLCRHIVVL